MNAFKRLLERNLNNNFNKYMQPIINDFLIRNNVLEGNNYLSFTYMNIEYGANSSFDTIPLHYSFHEEFYPYYVLDIETGLKIEQAVQALVHLYEYDNNTSLSAIPPSVVDVLELTTKNKNWKEEKYILLTPAARRAVDEAIETCTFISSLNLIS